MYEFLDKRYAIALYEVAKEKNKIDEYLNDFEEIVNLLKTNEECKMLINHPEVSTKQKRDIFKKLFEEKIDEGLLTFLLVLIDKGRIKFAEEKLNEFKKIHLERNNIIKVEIRTVIPLEEEEKKNLTDKLYHKYNKKILLEEKLDSEIIGGIYLKAGNDVIDYTLKSKLYDLREYIKKNGMR